ncbi:MAG: GNAT family N-acetyltransferase [Candidatus Omnitrophica bacterium]|nr:GNAT family N-acetyltransferase [Candidatus Omnitrophota bacterium]
METVLIDFNKEHIDKTFTWIQDVELRRAFLMRGEVSYSQHIQYFKKVLSDPTQKVYAIISDDLHVGNCGIKNIDLSKRSAEVWIYIGDHPARRMGIGDKALKGMLENCFEKLGLKEIYLHVADFNLAAINLYKKNGFKEAELNLDYEWSSRGCRIIFLRLRRDEWM